MKERRIGRRGMLLTAAAGAAGLVLPIGRLAAADDYAITIAGVPGHYWTQTGGYGMVGDLLDAYDSAGGAAVWGPPVSREYRDSVGRINQAVQRGIFQLDQQSGAITYANIFDQISATGQDPRLLAQGIPFSRDWSSDAAFGGDFNGITINHIAILEDYPDLLDEYTASPDWVNQNGLPMGVEDMGPWVAVRGQRTAYQSWNVANDAAGIAAGQITKMLGGDIAKEYDLVPEPAKATHLPDQNVYLTLDATPVPTPTPTLAPTLEWIENPDGWLSWPVACDAPITGILDYDTHPGAYDIMIPAGEPIYAASDGEVQGVVIQDSGSLGVELIHPRADGRTYMSQYFHMSRFIPGMAAGDMVVEGQLIGFTGSTGAMNSHVHFDFSDRTVGYVKLDPRPLFRATRLASTGYVDGPSGHNLPATAIIGRCPPGTSGYE